MCENRTYTATFRHRSDVIRHTSYAFGNQFFKLIMKFQNLFQAPTGFPKFGASKAGFHQRMTYDL